MRKLSFIFFALGALSPFVTWWATETARRNYQSNFGEAAEGTGFFGIVALGALTMVVLFAVSGTYAIRAYRTLDAPRTLNRKIELAILILPVVVVVGWICIGLLGLPYDAPAVIRTR